MRKSALLLWILIGASLSSSYATDGNPDNQSDADILRAQNRTFVETRYNNCVAKDEELIALQSKLETAKRNLQASQDYLKEFPHNPKLKAQLAQHQTAFNTAQEQYTAHRTTCLVNFYESCAKPEHADLAFEYATENLGRQDPSEKLEPDIIWHLIKSYPIVKDLYSVNKAFYDFAHRPELTDKFQHVIPDAEAFAQINCFCANVKLKFQALPDQLSKLQNVRVLDICDVNVGDAEALVLGQLPHIRLFNLGKANNYSVLASSLISKPESENAGYALSCIILKDPNIPNRLGVAQNLMWRPCTEESKSLAVCVIRQIMRDQKNPDRFNAAQHICDGLSYDRCFDDDDKRCACNLLSEGIQDKENPKRESFVLSLFNSKMAEHKNLVFTFFREKIQDLNDSNRSLYASSLLDSKDGQDQNLALTFYREVLKDKNNLNLPDAEKLLYFCRDQEAKQLTTYLLLTHLLSTDTAQICILLYRQLWKTQEDKDLALSIAGEISQQAENPYNSHAVYILNKWGVKKDKEPFVEAALDPSQGIEAQAEALKNIHKGRLSDPNDQAKLMQIAVTLVNDARLDLIENIHLISWAGKKNISEDTFTRLLASFDSERKDSLLAHNLLWLLDILLDCPYPDLQGKAEDLFLRDFLKFNSAGAGEGQARELKNIVKKLPEDKKQVWCEKTCEMLQSSTLDNNKNLQLACFVLTLSDQPQFVAPAQEVIRKTFSKYQTYHMSQVSPIILDHLMDADLKARIVSTFLKFVQAIDLTENGVSHLYSQKKALVTLLIQNDDSIRGEALFVCKNLIESMAEVKYTLRTVEFFGAIGLALRKIDAGQVFAEQIYSSLAPQFENILSEAKDVEEIYDASDTLKFFLVLGDEKQKSAVYSLCCNTIANVTHEVDINDAAKIITSTLGVEHPWSKEITSLMEKRKNELMW